MSTINVDNYGDGTDSVPASAVLEGTAKAWCNFDGTAGTISGRKDYNVSGYTDGGTGTYDFTFTNNMADADYTGATSARSSGGEIIFDTNGNNTASSAFLKSVDDSGVATDWQTICGVVHGDLA